MPLSDLPPRTSGLGSSDYVPVKKHAPALVSAGNASQEACEEVEVTGVYDEGKIIELDDSRHIKVEESDSVTSSVWVPPFDALICDDTKLINKDDNESVDLAP